MAGALERWGPVIALGAFAAWVSTRARGGAKAALPAPSPRTAVSEWRAPPPPTLEPPASLLPEWAFPYIPGIARVDKDSPDTADYITSLSTLFGLKNPKTGKLYWDPRAAGLEEYYTPNTLRKVAITAAGYHAIPAEWIWGQLMKESRRNPSQMWTEGGPSAAILAGSSGLGIAQQTRTQYRRERDAGGRMHRIGPHAWGIIPHLAIWRMAEAMRRGAEEAGRNLTPDEAAAYWDRGSLATVAGEGKHILRYGPSVYKPDKSAESFSADVAPWQNME